MLVALALAAQLVEPLAERHLRWLNEEAHFIASGEERSRFEALATGEERDAFIELFWRRRDPTPGTRANEAREAHELRLAASDRLFATGPRRGRFSERGRIYQLLGPPSFRETFAHAGHRLVPVELWHYTGVESPFLPESFHLVFFRPNGSAPFRLWSPVTDGPQALAPEAEPGRAYFRSGRDRLARVDPELASVVEEGLVPGAVSASVDLLAKLDALADLAAGELPARASVRAEAGFRELRADLAAAVLFDEAGVPEIHYAITLEPGQHRLLAWEREGHRSRARLTLSGRATEGDREVERWEDELILDLSEDELQDLDDARLSFQGRRVRRAEATGVEISLASPSLVYAAEARELPDAGLVVAPASAPLPPGSSPRLPFRVGERLLAPGSVPAGSAALALVQGAPGEAVDWELVREAQPVTSGAGRVGAGGLFELALPGERLEPGTYRWRASREGSTAETTFEVEARPGLPTRVVAREPTPEEETRYRRARARAFRASGRHGRAIEEMALAVELLPGSVDAQLELAVLRFAEGRCADVVRQLRPRAEDFGEADVFVFLGACSEKLGETEQARRDYERALALAPGDDALREALARLSGAGRENGRRNY